MAIKINSLQLENVKRVKAVALEPAENGLTVIGGKNGQGKTSVLDAIAWTIGGEKYRPSAAQRDGSVLPPDLRVTFSNGVTAIRKGNKGALTVTDETGKKSGQRLLDAFVEQFALNVPKFMEANDRDKASTLLRILGIEDKLDALDRHEKALYDTRTEVGRLAQQRQNAADTMDYYADAPEEPVSISELLARLQAAQTTNRENADKRRNVENLSAKVTALKTQAKEITAALESAMEDLSNAIMVAEELHDVDVDAISDEINSADQTNRMVENNRRRDALVAEADEMNAQYTDLTIQIEQLRADRKALLDGADLPLAGLGVEGGVLTMNGKPWDCMSGSEQLRAATAIVSRLNPDCGFVLLDKLEQMDTDTLAEFSAWLEERGMQAIATRVSTGSECTIIIEDGYAVAAPVAAAKKWTEGEF